jgi:hypothetical protein
MCPQVIHVLQLRFNEEVIMKKYAFLSAFVVTALGHSVTFAGGEQIKSLQANQSQLTKKASSKDGWTIARSKHNGSGIVTRYKIQGTPQIGQPVVIDISFSAAGSESAQAKVEVRPSEKLGLAVPASMSKTETGSQMSLFKTKDTSTRLTVTPQSEGLHQLVIKTVRDGRASVVSIPVLVGALPASQPTLGEKQTTPSGEKIIVMPAK